MSRALLQVVVLLSLELLSSGAVCPVNGMFCTIPCDIYQYQCSEGTRFPDQPLAKGTVCFDSGIGKAQVRFFLATTNV